MKEVVESMSEYTQNNHDRLISLEVQMGEANRKLDKIDSKLDLSSINCTNHASIQAAQQEQIKSLYNKAATNEDNIKWIWRTAILNLLTALIAVALSLGHHGGK